MAIEYALNEKKNNKNIIQIFYTSKNENMKIKYRYWKCSEYKRINCKVYNNSIIILYVLSKCIF